MNVVKYNPTKEKKRLSQLFQIDHDAHTRDPKRRYGHLFPDLELSLAEPKHDVKYGQRYVLGRHLLVVADPMTDWDLFVGDLKPGDWLVLYVVPTIAGRDLSHTARLVMVTPEPWIAGHLLDLWQHCQPDEPQP